jgi:methyl-accepting chemotaxis protein
LQTSVNATLRGLRTLVGNTQAASQAVSAVCERIMADATELASRVEGQAATLEETAATTEEIANGVRSTAAALDDAEALAAQVHETTSEGSGRVEEMISAVGRIQRESEEIAEIVNVIESIAFQTNLLALNAAVEAARAGQHGKGFAVVASEVRTLAQRASEAAKDIATKITESGASVEAGVHYAETAGAALGKIEARIETLVERIKECAETGRAQAGSVEEINRAIAHLDTIAQENAAASDRSAASAQSLASEVETLAELISSFRMDDAPEGLREAS